MLVRVLGPLAVQTDGASLGTGPEPVALGGRRQRTVLAALVARANHVVSLPELIDAVWPEAPPAAATGTIQAYISRLRGLLGTERVARTQGGYRLVLERDELDEWRLADALGAAASADDAQASVKGLLDALDLWRSQPLGDIGGELFAVPYVTALEHLHVRALDRAAELLLELDDAEQAADVLSGGISDHPRDQTLVARYMIAQARLHRPEAALSAYRTLTERLDRDLGVSPDEHVRTIAKTVAAASPSARSAVVAQRRRARSPHASMPDPNSALVGRRDELEALRAAAERHPVVTLVGPPGSGKTRLALELAWSLAPSFDGAYQATLEGVRDIRSLLSVLASACAVQEQPGAPLASTLARALRARGRVLLLLDSAEHLERDAVAQVGMLVESCPEIHVLVTSLTALSVPGEDVLPLSPLPVPQPDGRLLDADAGRLLLDRARVAQPGFSVSAANEATLVGIARSLDGLPLALELAAGQLAVLGPAELSRRLSDRFEVLLRPGVSGRHVSMHAALSTAVDELSDEQRAVLTRLGVAAGPLPLDVADEVCRDVAGSASGPRPALMGLVRRSLLVVDDRGVGMLESVRAFCWQRLHRRGDWDSAVRRHAEVLRSRLEGLAEHAHSPRQGWAAHEVELLHTEVLAALARLPERDARPLAGLVAAWWYRAGRLSDLAALASQFACDGSADASSVPVCGYAALALATDGSDWARARRLADAAVASADACNDGALRAEARLLRGDVATLVADWPAAAADLDYVIQQATQSWMVALARLRRLRVDWAVDPSSGGLASHRRETTAQAVRDAGDPQLVGYLRLTKSNRLLHMGHLAEAHDEMAAATSVFDEISHRPFHTLGTLLLAETEALRGRWDEAERLAQQALRRGQGTAAPFPWDPREILARCRIEQGETSTALAMLDELERESAGRGDATLRGVCVVDRLSAEAGDWQEAAALLASAPSLTDLPPWQRVDLLVAQVGVAIARGDVIGAEGALVEARDTLGSLGEPALVHEARVALAAAALATACDDASSRVATHLATAERLRERSGYSWNAAERRRRDAVRHHRSPPAARGSETTS